MCGSIWREERVGGPGGRGDNIMANLGSFSGGNMGIDGPEALAAEDLTNSF